MFEKLKIEKLTKNFRYEFKERMIIYRKEMTKNVSIQNLTI